MEFLRNDCEGECVGNECSICQMSLYLLAKTCVVCLLASKNISGAQVCQVESQGLIASREFLCLHQVDREG